MAHDFTMGYSTRMPLTLTAFCAHRPELDLFYVRTLALANEKVFGRPYGRHAPQKQYAAYQASHSAALSTFYPAALFIVLAR